MLSIRPFVQAETEAVVALWIEAGLARPWNDPRADIARKLEVQPELFFVGELEGRVVGTVMAGYDGHRGWIYYLAVAPAHQRRGFARALMQRAEHALTSLGCPKLNLQVRADNDAVLGFYERLGYIREERVSLGRRLERAPG